MRRGVVRAGGVIAIIGGVMGLLGVLLEATEMAVQFPGAISIFSFSFFITFGGLAVGLIGIGVALLGLWGHIK